MRTFSQSPVAKWEVHTVDFPLANTDFTLRHSLEPIRAHHVKFQVVDAKVGGVVYRGDKAPQSNYIVLRATVAGKYRIRLLLEANVDLTEEPL